MLRRILARFFLFALLAGALLGGLGYWHYQRSLQIPLHVSDHDIFTVKRGDNITTIAQRLQADGIIPSALPAIVHARLSGQASRLQAGDYRLQGNATIADLLADMAAGKVATFSITIVEGRTVAQLLAQIAADPHLEHTLAGKSDADIARALGIEGSLEGWFLPDTYHFPYRETDLALLKRLHQAMHDYLDAAWRKRADNLPLTTPYEALVLASIVEKETGVASEREQVAGVFVRRLQQGMRLQTDPAVIYGAKDYQGVITKSHLQTDTPYNTYTRSGLPPTPIALPSRASIEASLHPDDGDALYFVADGKGGHVFSATYEAHQKAVAAWRSQQK
ncbi:MAG: endolytic transglycosylase MltG [Cardiobacteriaceae bacterium]|nr:endolytic transglycosylase MltG [Cardiobacteriaceae bacterium]